ncbi:hypothetical protein GCM10023183_24480 [Nibribacter koreensis]|uniref:Uncharacterized protein n=1 Tax=Nibribacter koreensis TaxID=1084519 RepID=A0ABP8FP55_9BACT
MMKRFINDLSRTADVILLDKNLKMMKLRERAGKESTNPNNTKRGITSNPVSKSSFSNPIIINIIGAMNTMLEPQSKKT